MNGVAIIAGSIFTALASIGKEQPITAARTTVKNIDADKTIAIKRLS